MKKHILILSFTLFFSVSFVELISQQAPGEDEVISNVDKILNRLNEKTKELQSYQCHLEYLVRQPLFEAQTLRKGSLYYKKGPKASTLRINFDTIKQDDEPEEKEKTQYLFDGVWLTRTDYQNKSINHDQLTLANAPVEPFEMVSRYFPILGFSGAEDLKKQFTIEHIKPKKKAHDSPAQLRLTPRPDSRYKDDYTQIDFWIADKTHLPIKIIA